ncbi:MAG: CpaF family protein, partial [Anaerolineae bacterium]
MALLKRIKESQQSTTQSLGPTSRPREIRTHKPAAPPARGTYEDIKTRVQNQLIAELGTDEDAADTAQVQATIEQMMEQILAEENTVLGKRERERLYESIVAEILGYGPIQPFLGDDSITEIMVNGYSQIYIERNGKLERTHATFKDDDHVMRIIDRIVQPLGRRIDEASPYVNARLPDGSRVNAIIPPLCLNGPILTIRKFFKNPLTVEEMIRLGTVTPEAMGFLEACVKAKVNILISGGTGSGKTTFLNV